MGLRSLFSIAKKGNKKNIEEEKLVSNESKNFLKAGSQREYLEFIKENCELASESGKQVEKAKAEYQAVTSYLTDMQLIDMIPDGQREALEDASLNIVCLNKNRNRLRQKKAGIKDRQYRLFERYEKQIPKELPLISESETYQETIQKDMEYLDKEKKALSDQYEEADEKQAFLRRMGIITSVVIMLLFAFFAILSRNSEADYTLPFLLTVLLGMTFALYTFLESRKNNCALLQLQLKQSREVTLMNKIKIKYVNNRSYLDYIYGKYMVENYRQLKHLWEEYVVFKEEAKKCQNNTRQLEYYHRELVSELKRIGVLDCEIWLYQSNAIIDSKEMVEIRHRLNIRRQKLREQIETNMKQKEEAMSIIENAVIARPDYQNDAVLLLKEYELYEKT
jgi:hypothetical protein